MSNLLTDDVYRNIADDYNAWAQGETFTPEEQRFLALANVSASERPTAAAFFAASKQWIESLEKAASLLTPNR